MKAKLLRESGTDGANACEYELNHVIPLAVGEHPRNLKNLMLQPWDGAKKKDRLERRPQQLVCSKLQGLQDAQAAIWTDGRVPIGTGRLTRPLSPMKQRKAPEGAYVSKH